MQKQEILVSSHSTATPEPQTEVLDVILHRRSQRAYSEREVTPHQLETMLEAARWAASSYGEQPWRFIVGTKGDRENYEKLMSSLMEVNQIWAGNAPVLLLTLAKKTFSHNGSQNSYALHDTGMALANLMLQAQSMGLTAHPMGGFDRAKARAAFNVSDDYELGAAVAIGYPGDPEALSEGFRKAELAPRTRKPLAELVLAGPPEFVQ
jgi:nitroreductase